MTGRLVASAAAALWLGACSFEPALTAKFVEYNRVFEDSSNSVLMLNILRAKDRKPIHFSVVQSFSPTLTAQGEIGFSTTFNPTLYTPLGVTGRATGTNQNSASIAAEHTKKFMQGITRPVSIDVIDHYWQQRWPPEMLWNLFVGKVEIIPITADGKVIPHPDDKQKDAMVCIVANSAFHPAPKVDFALKEREDRKIQYTEFDDFCKALTFARVVEDFRRHLRFTRIAETSKIGPLLKTTETRSLKDLVEVAKAGLTLKTEKGGYQLLKEERKTTFCWDTEPGTGQASTQEGREERDTRRSSNFECKVPDIGKRTPDSTLGDGENSCPSMVAGTWKGVRLPAAPRCKYVIHIRSVEGIIYYLGSILRAQEDGLATIKIKAPGRAGQSAAMRDLFSFHKGSAPGGTGKFSVTYEGSTYFAADDGSRTIHILSFVTQLLALNREADELPRTVFVNVSQ